MQCKPAGDTGFQKLTGRREGWLEREIYYFSEKNSKQRVELEKSNTSWKLRFASWKLKAQVQNQKHELRIKNTN